MTKIIKIKEDEQMNEALAILKRLKRGKRVMIINKDKRYAILGVLGSFKINAISDGCFIELILTDEGIES